MTDSPAIPLEDELGDVLEKAMRGTGVNLEELAAEAGVPAARIRDAVDYRPDLSPSELRRLAAALRLNEVGLCALGAGRYPLPRIGALPFRLWPLRMRHGIGFANAYLVAAMNSDRGLLFDTGAGLPSIQPGWPPAIGGLDAVFLTHVETEHAGGLAEVARCFEAPVAYIPQGACAAGGTPVGEGAHLAFGGLEVQVFSTPGHAAAHSCYLVRATGADRPRRALLVSGDLVFAGSAGGGYFSPKQLQAQLRRLLGALPADTLIAPGHGPMTTVENELRFNPFAL
ncbi:MAG TPA: MBL fold metallo-hydrolase [Opitutaceae bacterium]|nr:MBL fold metallo-hydrolase [Opitutaceae bacterium]